MEVEEQRQVGRQEGQQEGRQGGQQEGRQGGRLAGRQEGQQEGRARLSPQELREQVTLRDLRYWLAAVHYNEIVSIQDEMLANQMSAGVKGGEGARASRLPLDRGPLPPKDWRVPHYSMGARWDALALAGLTLVALLLLTARLALRACRPYRRHRKTTTRREVPEEAESIPVDPSPEPVFPPPYSEIGPAPAPAPAPCNYPPPPYSENAHSNNKEIFDNIIVSTSGFCQCSQPITERYERVGSDAASSRRTADRYQFVPL